MTGRERRKRARLRGKVRRGFTRLIRRRHAYGQRDRIVEKRFDGMFMTVSSTNGYSLFARASHYGVRSC
jgi:hypothetical protein